MKHINYQGVESFLVERLHYALEKSRWDLFLTIYLKTICDTMIYDYYYGTEKGN